MSEKIWSMKKMKTNLQYRIEYEALTLGGILTLSKEEHLLTLVCAAIV